MIRVCDYESRMNRLGRWSADVGICLALIVVAALLIAPLFSVEYLDNWGSIDSTFIADARMLNESGAEPGWLPQWYAGTRFAYVYPTALRYGTAWLAQFLSVSTALAYHLYTASLYCLGSAGLFFLLRVLKVNRIWASAGGLAWLLVSPSFVLLPLYGSDSLLAMPQRLNVLIKYGEGPHVSSLSLMPFALGLCWVGLQAGGLRLHAAGIVCALVVAHNFYGAVGLALLAVVMVLSLWIYNPNRKVLLRAGTIGLIAAGLNAFWLTPSYFSLTAVNLSLVALPGNLPSRIGAFVLLAVFAGCMWLLARRQAIFPEESFALGAVLLMLYWVVGFARFGVRVVGEPHRFVPELDLVLILGLILVLSRLGPGWALGLMLSLVPLQQNYLEKPWAVVVEDHQPQARPEYRIAHWLHQNPFEGRTYVTGSLRYWFNVWYNGLQIGGGSDQGLLNPALALAQWQMTRDEIPGRDIDWLKAMGADRVVMHDQTSRVIYHDYANPGKYGGLLVPLYADGEGNTIYKVPRRFSALARIVNSREIQEVGGVPFTNENTNVLRSYVKAIEEGPDQPVKLIRVSPREIRLAAKAGLGESLLVQESFDSAWSAVVNGVPVPIVRDPVGFMLVAVPEGNLDVRLHWAFPREVIWGRCISLLTFCLLLGAAGIRFAKIKIRVKD